jgi:penicillin-binding protein 1C
VVGLEAAAWRYFGRAPDDLSWAEAALLAVLPNAPSLIYPGKNHEKLAAKRNKLINRLIEREFIDPESGRLAMKEELPGKPLPLEQAAPHLLDRIFKEKPGQLCRTTIEYSKQKAVAEIIEIHHRELNFSEINNAAALVLETESGNVLAYVGNTQSPDTSIHGNDVDIILAPRSTGSILKPLLYAAMLDDGEILPNTLIADIPTRFGGMTPQNFDGSFAGAVPASKALYQSLNVPAVRLLQRFGVQHFYDVLKKCGFTTLSRPPDHYGLSLILGGAETTLWDLASAYSGMARELNHYAGNNGKYDPRDWHPPVYFLNNNPEKNPGEFSREANLIRDGILSASAVWFTFKAMKEVNRPPDYFGWKSFSSSSAIAWKTGTSFGFRDAWALGVTPEYIVAVWVGNADGEGRSGLTGIATAAPILFDIFNILPETSWFDPPYDDMARAAVCRQSGQRANPYCEPVDTTWIPAQGTKSSACIYHHLIHLDKTGKYRVTDACYPPSEMVHVSWFILPPVMEWYYKKLNPLYRNLPSLYSGCESDMSTSLMEFIYPADHNKIYLPIDLDGTKGSVILEVAHRNPHSTVFWHIDNDYLGMTTGIHQLEVCPSFGKHNLTVTDERGSSVTREIEILEPDSQK